MKKSLIMAMSLLTCVLNAQSSVYTVERLFELAMTHSPDRAILALRVDQAQEETKKSEARRLPLLSASASYSYLGIPPQGVTLEAGELGIIPGATPILLPSEETVFLEDTGNHYFQMGLILDQPLYTWGKLNGAVSAAKGSEQIQRIALSGEENKILTEIKTLISTLSLLQAMEEDLQSQEEIVPRLITIVEQSLTSGFLLREDLLEVKILTAQVALSRQELNNRRDKILNRLSRLTGQKDLTPLDLVLSIPTNPAVLTLPSEESLLQGLISNNSDLSQLAGSIKVRESLTHIASYEKTSLPDMGFRLELNYAHDTLPFTNKEMTTGLSATASLSLQSTFFDGGRKKADLSMARSQEEEARLNYEETRRILEDKIGEDLSDLALIEARITHEELITEKIREEIKVKKNLFQAGAAGEEELLKKELEALGSSLAVKGEMINYYTLLYSLEYLTGGAPWATVIK